jgi:hypothetical protein
MLSTLVRQVSVGIAVAMLTATLGACSSADESPGATGSARQEPSETRSSERSPEGTTAKTEFEPADLPDPGEDLLDPVRSGAQFTGATLEASWRFPASFEPDPGETTRAYSEDKHLRITVGSGPGDQTKAAAAMKDAQRQASAKGQTATLDTVTVASREFAVLVQDTPEVGIITYAHAPEEGQEFYIVQLASDLNLADVPEEQFDAFLQTVGSLEFETA